MRKLEGLRADLVASYEAAKANKRTRARRERRKRAQARAMTLTAGVR